MLDAFIIEEIQRREREQGRVQPQLERPEEPPFPPTTREIWSPTESDADDEHSDRGVVILDM